MRHAKVEEFVVLVGGQQFAPNVVLRAKSHLSDAEWIQVSDAVTANLIRQRIYTCHSTSTSIYTHNTQRSVVLHNSCAVEPNNALPIRDFSRPFVTLNTDPFSSRK